MSPSPHLDSITDKKRATIGYASGNLGKSLFWTSLEYLLLFYITEVVGISPGWAGIIIMVSLVWDGITDPLMGWWVDRRSSKGHDYRPYLRWGPPLCGLAFATIFVIPFQGELAKVVYLLLANLLFRSVYTLFDVPHNALLAKIPLTSNQRTSLSAWRYFFSSIGALTVALAVAPLLNDRASSGDTSAFLAFSGVATVIACVTVWQSLRIARLVARSDLPPTPAMGPIAFLRTVLCTPAALAFFAIACVNALTLPLFARMTPYLAKYNLDDQSWASLLFLAFATGQISAMPIWTALSRWIGKEMACIIAYGLLLLVMLAGAAGASLPFMLVGISLMAGLTVGALNMLVWSLAPDIVDCLERWGRGRPDATFMSFLTFTQKSAIGIGSLLAGLTLSLTEFTPDQSQSELSLSGILIVAFGLPVLGAMVGALLAWRLKKLRTADQ